MNRILSLTHVYDRMRKRKRENSDFKLSVHSTCSPVGGVSTRQGAMIRFIVRKRGRLIGQSVQLYTLYSDTRHGLVKFR